MELDCNKKIMLIINTYIFSFQKKTLPNSTCFLIHLLTKCVENGFDGQPFRKLCYICIKRSVTEFTVNEVTVCRVAVFLYEALLQI